MIARLTAAAALLLVAACSSGGSDATGTPANAQTLGPDATRDYPLNGFDRVELAGIDAVSVRTGPGFAVRAQGPQGVLDRLDIRVQNGTLKVGRRSDSLDWGGERSAAKVVVTLPKLAGATVSGSGDMDADRADGDRFEAAVAGSGDLTVRIEAKEAVLSIAGSGNLTARGKIANGTYSVAGSGELDADDLEAGTIRASVAGSGDISAKATGSAAVSIIGSGDVAVGGGARCTVNKVGSGDAKCD
ncbi:head GIN domain-containing protein [Sphingomonas jatrophae]|uniref:Putative auto-transporter adhesin, head GIN domain n=1 Tax=Sphingomonas jatrophae TaxID=1166337 RepID=A0A1I6LIX8_9SPHN|nr:head GIN domain-containing protein [Sphingomonas jatrophae]SFS03434.1 Putative auto-transporter adhesin, head GIN domain [Sphingomonas jatrophae]